LLWQLW
jgi:hypothetical protein